MSETIERLTGWMVEWLIKKSCFILLLTWYIFTPGCVLGASAPYPQPIGLEKINNIYPPLKTTLPTAVSTTSAVQPQPVDFINCIKYFKMDSQRLFYLTLAGINANRFRIDEIQSQSGYVIFTAAQKHFLANIIPIDTQNSMLKITPCSNIYYFPVGIVQNMFKYIELNVSTPVQKLSVL